ncbi:unnamed protein product [Tilletia controversa]|nr:unnamed protein product [Tilletia controversa]
MELCSTQIVLAPVNPYLPIGETFIQNGDTLVISQSAAHTIDYEAVQDLTFLSHTSNEGELYDDYDGPLTRVDEARLRINFDSFWQQFPSKHFKCRARDNSTINDLAQIISKFTNVPINQLRITHDGIRARGEIGQYRNDDRVDLDVHHELPGAGTAVRYQDEVLEVPGIGVPNGMCRIEIKMNRYNVQLDTTDNVPFCCLLDFLRDQIGQEITLNHEGRMSSSLVRSSE